MGELTNQEILDSLRDQIALVFKVDVPGWVGMVLNATPEGIHDILERIEVPETRADLRRLGALH